MTAAGVPTVSVVIATKNRRDLVRGAIESVLALRSERFELDLVVVDDGSTDDTVEAIAEYPIRVVAGAGTGMANARSTGLRAAVGDFVTIFDDDDVMLPTAITAQLDEFDRHPSAGLVHAQAQRCTADLEPFGVPFPESPIVPQPELRDLLGYFPQVGTILTRMDAAREAGDFDPSLAGDNDWDWLLRVAARHPVRAVEVPVMLFRQRDDPFEELAWRRFPAMLEIFRRHTRHLPVAERLRLQPVIWSNRGWHAAEFLSFAQDNWAEGERRRAARSVGYAFRASPVHAVAESGRRLARSAMARVRPVDQRG